MTDIWDEIEIPEPVMVPETTFIEETTIEVSTKDKVAEEKRAASIAARALERAALDAERAARAQRLQEEKQRNKKPTVTPKELSPYEEFIEAFIETRRKELVKKNGRGFIGGFDKNRNPTRGADYERAVQDANYAWKNR
jgi:hypothetical protein